VAKLKAQRKYLRHSLRFIWQMEDAVVVVGKEMLGSSVTTDALEAIQFMVIALEFQLEPAKTAVRAMLALVWSKEPSVQKATLEAFRSLWLAPNAARRRRDGAGARRGGVAARPDARHERGRLRLARGVHGDGVSPGARVGDGRRGAVAHVCAYDARRHRGGRAPRADAARDAGRRRRRHRRRARSACCRAPASASRWIKDPVLAQYAALALQRVRTTESQDRAVQLAVAKANRRVDPQHPVVQRAGRRRARGARARGAVDTGGHRGDQRHLRALGATDRRRAPPC
jgi:hypothetical protein